MSSKSNMQTDYRELGTASYVSYSSFLKLLRWTVSQKVESAIPSQIWTAHHFSTCLSRQHSGPVLWHHHDVPRDLGLRVTLAGPSLKYYPRVPGFKPSMSAQNANLERRISIPYSTCESSTSCQEVARTGNEVLISLVPRPGHNDVLQKLKWGCK